MKRSPLRRVSKKQAALNRKRVPFAQQVLETVPFCEARLEHCTGRSVDVHEIITRGRRGSIIDRENVAALCRRCHDFITVNPGWSQAHGWMLHHGATSEDKEEARLARSEFLRRAS